MRVCAHALATITLHYPLPYEALMVLCAEGGVALGILESSVNPTAWKNEVERVAPRLKGPAAGVTVSGAGAGREWRTHLEQTGLAESSIGKVLPDTRNQLENIASTYSHMLLQLHITYSLLLFICSCMYTCVTAAELFELMQTVTNRERYINTSFKTLAVEYGSFADHAADIKSSFQSSANRVSTLTGELATLNEALEDIQASMEDKGSSMTDTSPLIKIKTALQDIRNEVKLMDLHLGVVGHAVMQSKINHKTAGHSTSKHKGDDSDDD
jgi:estrogen-related receptor beta like 1